jgi:hypothetical protein
MRHVLLHRNKQHYIIYVITVMYKRYRSKEYFFVTAFYLQSVAVHSANCVKTYTVACRRVLSGAPLQLMGSRPLVDLARNVKAKI